MGQRRLQTFVIGLVVLLSTTTLVVALALLDASSAPFDRAFASQRGAHVVAAYDATKVTNEQLLERRTGVTDSAGPFGQTVLESGAVAGRPGGRPLTVVGRADPAGPVDRLDLWQGRWATAPGEIVLNAPPAGGRSRPDEPTTIVVGGTTYTIVGRAFSLSQSADAWVSPEQMAALRPTTTQMLYRFSGDPATKTAVESMLAGVTTGLPSGALIAAQSYLTVKDRVAAGPGTYVPLLAAFGALGLVVAVLIVGNVVSGAVVSGFRHIGILKAIGFTPRQVAAVYLVMVSVPAVVGCVLGTVAGDLGTRPLLAEAFDGLGLGGGIGASAWVLVTALVGVPAIVVLAALVPVTRAHRLSAAEAISAGSAPRTGRGLRVQRRLSRTRLPRPVSLGLGLPFARPGRTALTMAAVLLGVTTVTFATGIADTLGRVAALSERVSGDVRVMPVRAAAAGTGMGVPPGAATTTKSDAEIEALLRGLPHAARVAAMLNVEVSVVGQSQPLSVCFARGDVAGLGYEDQILAGRWMRQPDEVVAPTQLLRERGLSIGDKLILELGGRRTTVTIVGQIMRPPPGPRDGILADWGALTALAPDGQVRSGLPLYQVQLDAGASRTDYVTAVMEADPGLNADGEANEFEFQVIVVGFSTVLATLLALVAALGVLNTVALNVHERRRDLGMLKSIGMTPRQVVGMVVTSMAAIGLLSGLLGIPVGVLAHRMAVPLAADAVNISLPPSVLDVWNPLGLAVLALAGLGIAVLGALPPARRAARLTIAAVLHNE
jgi:cell division protein FtsX